MKILIMSGTSVSVTHHKRKRYSMLVHRYFLLPLMLTQSRKRLTKHYLLTESCQGPSIEVLLLFIQVGQGILRRNNQMGIRQDHIIQPTERAAAL